MDRRTRVHTQALRAQRHCASRIVCFGQFISKLSRILVTTSYGLSTTLLLAGNREYAQGVALLLVIAYLFVLKVLRRLEYILQTVVAFDTRDAQGTLLVMEGRCERQHCESLIIYEVPISFKPTKSAGTVEEYHDNNFEMLCRTPCLLPMSPIRCSNRR